MPSSSAAQHRWIGYLHSDPAARERAGMSKAKVDEWLHADRGSPWKHRDYGGGIDPTPSGTFTIPIQPEKLIDMGLRGYQGMRSRQADEYQAHQAELRARPLAPQPPSTQDESVRGYDMGGGIGAMNPASGGILPGSANPLMQGQMQQLSALPDEKLQELAVRMPNNPMISRALAQRHMHAATMGSAPATGSGGILPTTPPAQPPQGSGILPQPQARGGTIEHRDAGGSMLGMPLGEASPWWERSEQRGMEEGYLHGNTFGRADHLTTAAPGGSYIVPADVISGIGEGNSLAGASAVEHFLNTGPWGTPLRGGRRGHGLPSPPRGVPAYRGQGEAKGGGVQGGEEGVGAPVPVKLSHGEYQIGPRRVLMIGRYLLRKHGGKGTNDKLAMKLGHDALDEWVKHERKKIVSKMAKLPGPTRATGGRLVA